MYHLIATLHANEYHSNQDYTLFTHLFPVILVLYWIYGATGFGGQCVVEFGVLAESESRGGEKEVRACFIFNTIFALHFAIH